MAAKESPKGITLSELIRTTSEELTKARVVAADAVMQFDKCELELAVSVKAEAKGGFKFWVLEAGGGVAGETVSKVKISFAPVSGEKVPVYNTPIEDAKGVDPEQFKKR